MDKRTRALQILLTTQSIKKNDALAEKNIEGDKLERIQQAKNAIIDNLQETYAKLNESFGGSNGIDVATIEQYNEYIQEMYDDYQHAEEKCAVQERHFGEIEQLFFEESNKEKTLKSKLEESVHADQYELQNRDAKNEEDAFATRKLAEVLEP